MLIHFKQFLVFLDFFKIFLTLGVVLFKSNKSFVFICFLFILLCVAMNTPIFALSVQLFHAI